MKTILVVDDSPDVRKLTALMLREVGYDVHEAVNGADALKVLNRLGDVPCLILLEMMSTVMDGATFLAGVGSLHRVTILRSSPSRRLLRRTPPAAGRRPQAAVAGDLAGPRSPVLR